MHEVLSLTSSQAQICGLNIVVHAVRASLGQVSDFD